jgi:hypothetical protein
MCIGDVITPGLGACELPEMIFGSTKCAASIRVHSKQIGSYGFGQILDLQYSKIREFSVLDM